MRHRGPAKKMNPPVSKEFLAKVEQCKQTFIEILCNSSIEDLQNIVAWEKKKKSKQKPDWVVLYFPDIDQANTQLRAFKNKKLEEKRLPFFLQCYFKVQQLSRADVKERITTYQEAQSKLILKKDPETFKTFWDIAHSNTR